MNEENNSRRIKNYNKWVPEELCYSSMEVMELTGISLRTLRYRINEVKDLVGIIDNVYYKKNKDWIIHQNLVHYFLRKTRKRKINNVYDIDWKGFVTWIPEENYTKEYHSHIIRSIMELSPNSLFLPVIETTKSGVNHVHIISDLETKELDKYVRKVLKDYWSFWECRIEVEPIRDKILAVNYILKDEMAFKTIYKNEQLIESVINRYQNEKFY